MSAFTPEQETRLVACLDVLHRIGATSVNIRFHDEPEPVVWVVDAHFPQKGGAHEAAAAMEPVEAAFRLCETCMDGGLCLYCQRTTGIAEDWQNRQPLDALVCWYVFDPETGKFRRSCEGEPSRRPGRNEPCPCGSGDKFKNCHGGRS